MSNLARVSQEKLGSCVSPLPSHPTDDQMLQDLCDEGTFALACIAKKSGNTCQIKLHLRHDKP